MMLAAIGVAAPAASAKDEVVTRGAVTATFSYERVNSYQYTDLWLTIDRAGVTSFDEPIDIPTCDDPYCSPANAYLGRKSVRVRDLDGDGEPEVLVDVFTGGAHCCMATEIVRFDGSRYRARSRNWADAGYRLIDLEGDGQAEFRTGDARFAYEFASYADSAFPIRVLHWNAGRFANATREYPGLVRKDAKRWKRIYQRRRDGDRALGVLAAWTADQYMLGRRKQARRFLAHERRAGRLRSFPGWKSGGAYVRQLKRKLRRWGY